MVSDFDDERELRTPRREEPKKKMSLTKKMFILVGVFVLVAGFIYIVSVAKYGSLDETQVNQTGVNQTGEQNNNTKAAWTFIAFLMIGGGIFYLLKSSSKPKVDISSLAQKKPVMPNRAIELVKRVLCEQWDFPMRYDPKIKDFVPVDSNVIKVNSRIPHSDKYTGDNFLIAEIEISSGEKIGLHTLNIPIDRGEEVILGGFFRIDEHTPQFQYRHLPRTFPMSTSLDKADRMKMLMLDNLEPEQLTGDVMKMISQTNAVQPPVQTRVSASEVSDVGSLNQSMNKPYYRPYRPWNNYRRPYRRW